MVVASSRHAPALVMFPGAKETDSSVERELWQYFAVSEVRVWHSYSLCVHGCAILGHAQGICDMAHAHHAWLLRRAPGEGPNAKQWMGGDGGLCGSSDLRQGF